MRFTKDLTDGNVARQLITFSLPLLFTNCLQMVHGLADMAVVGRFVGPAGLTAVSNGTMLAFIIGSAGGGLALGGMVLVAQYKGAENEAGQHQSVSALMALMLLASLVVTPIALLLNESIFHWMRVPEEAFQSTIDYMAIMIMGTVFYYYGSAFSAVLRGLGDSLRPLYFMAVGAVFNVILDLLLVGYLGWGVRGAAIASVMAQASSLIFAIMYLSQIAPMFSLRGQLLIRPQWDKMKTILRIGLPSSAQLVIVNISYLLTTGFLNPYGVVVAASAGIGLKICTLAVMPCWAIGQSVMAMVAQNMGARKFDRVRHITLVGLRINVLFTTVVVIAVQLSAGLIMEFFAPNDIDVIREGIGYLRICCSAGVLFYAAMYTYHCLAIGAGAASLAMTNSILEALFLRVGGIILLQYLGYGLVGIYIGQAASAVVTSIIGGVYFYSRLWQKRQLV